MLEISMHICHCTLYEFQLENNASAPARHTCAALSEDAVADCTCPDCFRGFHEGDTSLEDRSRSGYPAESDIE